MPDEDLHIPERRLGELCVRYGVSSLALFGSRARGDARPDSDVDLLVTFLPNVSVGLVHLGRLQAELEALLGARVDLVPRDGLKPLIRDSVLSACPLRGMSCSTCRTSSRRAPRSSVSYTAWTKTASSATTWFRARCSTSCR